MDKIERYSHVFKILCMIALWLLPISLILYWINPFGLGGMVGQSLASLLFDANFVPQGMDDHVLMASTRFFAFLINLIPVGLTMGLIYALMRLFSYYEKGVIFEMINAYYIRLIGVIMLIKALVVPTVYNALITLDLSWHNPPGHRFFNFSIYVSQIVIAIIVIMISWVMREAAKIKTEQDYTV